jgi:hypothetical protein
VRAPPRQVLQLRTGPLCRRQGLRNPLARNRIRSNRRTTFGLQNARRTSCTAQACPKEGANSCDASGTRKFRDTISIRAARHDSGICGSCPACNIRTSRHTQHRHRNPALRTRRARRARVPAISRPATRTHAASSPRQSPERHTSVHPTAVITADPNHVRDL